MREPPRLMKTLPWRSLIFGCQPTQTSPYFNSNVARAYDTYRIRPTMSLAAASVEETKKRIDRGVASDNTNPAGTAYLVSTTDKAKP